MYDTPGCPVLMHCVCVALTTTIVAASVTAAVLLIAEVISRWKWPDANYMALAALAFGVYNGTSSILFLVQLRGNLALLSAEFYVAGGIVSATILINVGNVIQYVIFVEARENLSFRRWLGD